MTRRARLARLARAALGAAALAGALARAALGAAALAGALLAAAPRAIAAPTLLAVISSDGTILSVDPSTGLANPVLTYKGPDHLTALAFDPQGLMWGVDANRGNPLFVRIQPFSGAAMPVGPTGLGPGAKLSGMDADPLTGTIFAIEETTGDVYTIDTFTGAATWAGNAGAGAHRWKGLTLDPSGRAFALREKVTSALDLVELDPLTWTELESCPLPAADPFVMDRIEARAPAQVCGIARSQPFFGDDDGWLVGLSPGSCSLESIGSTGLQNLAVDGGLTAPPACGVLPATQNYGSGTAGSLGVPQIQTNVPPNVPSLQPLEVHVSNAKPLTPVVVVFSLFPLLPGQVPFLGGSLLVDPAGVAGQVQVFSDAQGLAVVSIGMVPPALALCALQLYAQGFVLEGPPSGGGIVLTAGLELTFGS